MVRLNGRSVCSKKMVEDFWDVHFPVLQLKAGLLILIWMACLASLANCFTVLVYYPEVGDVGSGAVGNAVHVNCTSDITIVFFYSIFQTSAGISYIRNFHLGKTSSSLCLVVVTMEFYLYDS